MNTINYNGVALQLETINTWDCRAVMSDDGADHLYDEYRIGATCWFTPGTTGSVGPQSWQQLHHRLKQPRQPLTVVFDGVVVLQSPQPQRGNALVGGQGPPPAPLPSPGPNPQSPGGVQQFGSVVLPYPPTPSPPLNTVQLPAQPPPVGNLARLYRCDAKNGPVPVNVQVKQVVGTRTFLVYFEVLTWLAWQAADASEPSVLSHRWEMSHDIDENHFTTRTVEGSAVFRGDLLYDQPGQPQRVPDDFRLRLLHPIPNSFRRTGIQVIAAGDGLSVRYRFQDVEQDANLGLTNPITRFEGYYKIGFDSTPGIFTTTSRYLTYVVKVWGRKTTTRQQLQLAAVVSAQKVGFADLKAGAFAPKLFAAPLYYKADLAMSMHEKYCELTVGAYIDSFASFWLSGSFAGAVNAVSGNLINFPEAVTPIPIDQATPLQPAPPPPDNPRPPAGGGRGTYLGRLVAQQLTGEWTAPAPTPSPDPPAVDFSF